MSGFLETLEEVPDRVSEALSPLASHVPLVVRQLDELTGSLHASPPVPAPDDAAVAQPASPAPAEPAAPQATPDWGGTVGWDDLDEEQA